LGEDTVVVPMAMVKYAVGCEEGRRIAAALEFHRPEMEDRYRRAIGRPTWEVGPFCPADCLVLLSVPADTQFDLLEGLLVDIALSYSLNLKPPFEVISSRWGTEKGRNSFAF
jgi:hypothetical protein